MQNAAPPLDSANDPILMEAYASGDEHAFQVLYARHSGKIYGFLKSKLDSRSDVDEVFQLVFLKFHQNRSKYDPKFPVLQWLFVIARTSLLDFLRSKSRQSSHEQIENLDFSSQNTAERTLINQEDLRLSEVEISNEQKEIVRLRVFDELSYQEISVKLGKSSENVRQIFSRAIKRLRGDKIIRRSDP